MVYLSQPNMTWLYSQVSDTLTISYHLVDASNRYPFMSPIKSLVSPENAWFKRPKFQTMPTENHCRIKIETSKKRKCHFQLGKN